MIRLRIISLLIGSAALSCAAQEASAQSAYSYPWCATNGGGESCYYATLEQCIATTAGGRGGRCLQSPYFRRDTSANARSQEAALPRVANHSVVRQSRAAALPNVRESRAAQSNGAASASISDQLAALDYQAILTSAELGDAVAQFNLAMMYDYGRGVLQDYVQAHKWYNLAAARSTKWEAEIGTSAVSNRDRLTAKMTPSQVADAQKMAREWEPKQER